MSKAPVVRAVGILMCIMQLFIYTSSIVNCTEKLACVALSKVQFSLNLSFEVTRVPAKVLVETEVVYIAAPVNVTPKPAIILEPVAAYVKAVVPVYFSN